MNIPIGRKPVRLAGRATVLVASLSVFALGADFDVFQATPGSGTVGTEFWIGGRGFGGFSFGRRAPRSKRIKAKLQRGETPKERKTLPVKITGLEDAGLTAHVRRPGPAGFYSLIVQAGGEKIFTEGGFQMREPRIESVTEKQGEKGRELVIDGTDLGTRKGRVFGGMTQIDPPVLELDPGLSDGPSKRRRNRPPGDMYRAKVLTWENHQVCVLLHKKTPAGPVDVFLDNKVGTTTGRSVTVNPPSLDDD